MVPHLCLPVFSSPSLLHRPQNRTAGRLHLAEADDVAAAEKLREAANLEASAGDTVAHDVRLTEADLAESRAALLSPTRTQLTATAPITHAARAKSYCSAGSRV